MKMKMVKIRLMTPMKSPRQKSLRQRSLRKKSLHLMMKQIPMIPVMKTHLQILPGRKMKTDKVVTAEITLPAGGKNFSLHRLKYISIHLGLCKPVCQNHGLLTLLIGLLCPLLSDLCSLIIQAYI